MNIVRNIDGENLFPQNSVSGEFSHRICFSIPFNSLSKRSSQPRMTFSVAISVVVLLAVVVVDGFLISCSGRISDNFALCDILRSCFGRCS